MIKRFRNWVKRKLPSIIITTLILLLLILFFWSKIFVTVKSGQAGVLYLRLFGGTITDYVYPEGMHIVFPWDTMYIYNVRIQTTLHDFDVLTNRGLPIKLQLAIRFHPEYEMVGLLHQQVGPDYVNTIIIPEIESILRKKIGHFQPEDIYINKENILTDIIVKALDELGQKFVKVNDVIIRKVSLPEAIGKAIEDKLVTEQHLKAYDFRLLTEEKEAERKNIEAEGIRQYQDIISQTLSKDLLTWQGINATLDLAKSANAKIVVIGSGDKGLPIILNMDR
ncbi:MAG: prohibitin family protein [Candidatus Marithrix sp.]